MTASVLTIGNFDGVHRGHQHLIAQVVDRARYLGLRSVCITFDPLPQMVLYPERGTTMLSDRSEKVELIRALGVDEVRVFEFTREFSRLLPEDFIALLQQEWHLAELWMGTDFAIGRDRSGTLQVIAGIAREQGFALHVVPPFRHEGTIVSSTLIRRLIGEGDVERAAVLLGRPYGLEGLVVAGANRGRTLGFPTANVSLPAGRTIPADGVYAAQVVLAGVRRPAVVNLGGRPTFDEHARLVEAHLLDWSGDLYGQKLRIEFVVRLRGVRRFASPDELREQIARDVQAAREVLKGGRV